MTEKSLELAFNDIVKIIQEACPNVENKKKQEIAKEILSSIDWNNEILMHKGLRWITVEYMKKGDACNAM